MTLVNAFRIDPSWNKLLYSGIIYDMDTQKSRENSMFHIQE